MENGFRILVVDNEVDLVEILRIELTDAGYAVSTAYNGGDALATLRREEVDLMLLDLNMPGIDGFQVLEVAKTIRKDLKIIVLTGYGDLATAIRCKKMGADHFLSKPYYITELLIELERLLVAQMR